jgi:hypothetical protein
VSFPLPPDALDRNVVFDFFWQFSVFEFALKHGGFVRSRNNNSYAEADWKTFGNTIDEKFTRALSTSPDFGRAVLKIRSLSPRREMYTRGRLHWEHIDPLPNESQTAFTLTLLKTVRNNLFHGGKYPNGRTFDTARNRELLHISLTILNKCYELHPGIRDLVHEIAAA